MIQDSYYHPGNIKKKTEAKKAGRLWNFSKVTLLVLVEPELHPDSLVPASCSQLLHRTDLLHLFYFLWTHQYLQATTYH